MGLDQAKRMQQLYEALKKIVEANDEFRESLPRNWESDPVNDACQEAKPLLHP